MRRLRDRVPPPNSLLVFEAASRHLSFTRAAAELRVTQAAVSRQIQLLEDHLGLELFRRLPRSLRLTPQGERLQAAVSIGLHHIAEAADELRHERDASDVTISSSVTFASYWLMSRVAKFRAHFPAVDVRLLASTRTKDLAASGVDLAIRYGRGAWPGLAPHFLFGNAIVTVCAPSYLDAHGPFKTPAELPRARLLHLDQFDSNWVTWETWLKAFGVALPQGAERLAFDNYSILIHAAVRGEGVALCGERLAEDLIAHNELVRPVEASLPSHSSFYLVYAADRPLRADALQFKNWLVAEAKG